MSEPTEITLEEKVEFLSRPTAYPDQSSSVECIETHFSWLFLSGKFAYKLKKPLRFQFADFTTLSARKGNCETEVDLNRRLAEDVYIGAVPLCIEGSQWSLEAGDQPIEWLVKMHRLPRQTTLERAAVEGRVTKSELQSLIVKLSGFYGRTQHAPWAENEYLQRLYQSSESYGYRLSDPEYGLDTKAIRRLVQDQHRYIETHSRDLSERIARRQVVDTHGDLRPEHIFLGDNPQIIDCLEFNTALRLQDSAEELVFLVLECEHLDRAETGEQILDLFQDSAEYPASPDLLQFYRSKRALVRALISAWHLEQPDVQNADKWIARAYWYLDTAQASIESAL